MPIQAVIQAVYTGYTGCLYRLSIQAIQVVYTGYTGYTGGCIITSMVAPRASIQAIQPGLCHCKSSVGSVERSGRGRNQILSLNWAVDRGRAPPDRTAGAGQTVLVIRFSTIQYNTVRNTVLYSIFGKCRLYFSHWALYNYYVRLPTMANTHNHYHDLVWFSQFRLRYW